MLGSITAMLVGAWFYHGARRSGKSSISRAISGVVVYFSAALLWTLLITPSIKVAAGHGQSGVLIFWFVMPIFLWGRHPVAFSFLVNKSDDA